MIQIQGMDIDDWVVRAIALEAAAGRGTSHEVWSPCL